MPGPIDDHPFIKAFSRLYETADFLSHPPGSPTHHDDLRLALKVVEDHAPFISTVQGKRTPTGPQSFDRHEACPEDAARAAPFIPQDYRWRDFWLTETPRDIAYRLLYHGTCDALMSIIEIFPQGNQWELIRPCIAALHSLMLYLGFKIDPKENMFREPETAYPTGATVRNLLASLRRMGFLPREGETTDHHFHSLLSRRGPSTSSLKTVEELNHDRPWLQRSPLVLTGILTQSPDTTLYTARNKDRAPNTGDHQIIKILHTQDPDKRRMIEAFFNNAVAISRCLTRDFLNPLAAFLPVYTGHTTYGRPFLSMPMVDGPSLHDFSEKDGHYDMLVDIFEQIGTAMAEAHGCGCAHRDLKPENILIAPYRDAGVSFRRVVIIDWEIGFMTTPEPLTPDHPWSLYSLHQQGFRACTTYYAPPEVLEIVYPELTIRSVKTPSWRSLWPKNEFSLREDPPRADVYAFGVMMYEAFTGQMHPFLHSEDRENIRRMNPVEAARSIASIVYKQFSSKTRPIRYEGIPEKWRPFIERCVYADPIDRYPDMETAMQDFYPIHNTPRPWQAHTLL